MYIKPGMTRGGIMTRSRRKDIEQVSGAEKTSGSPHDAPFLHRCCRRLSRFWLLAVFPAVILIVKTGSLVPGVCAGFAANSLLTVLFYGEDKFLAQHDYWRIPEKYLHIWEFLCGWPGALYAQHAFRHKLSKTSFMIVFWLCVIANIAALFLLFRYVDPAKIGNDLVSWRRQLPL